MSESNIEGMKKIIEEKKKQSAKNSSYSKQLEQNKVGQPKIIKRMKRGGLFDK
ncbi:hypothetical protein JR334_00545 [Clostridia bacterium]|nr:hypothetical protein JR334_00545 [Clostridia bacterium]